MKNIPVFTTSHGIATLVLREIPYSAKAYILPRSVFTNAEELVQECAGFCRAAGAEQIFVQLDAPLASIRFQCEIWELERSGSLPEPKLELTAVTEENAEAYQTLYNRAFQGVDNAAYCTISDAKQAEGAWLHYENGEAVGLGQVQGDELRAIASARRGLGYDLAIALMHKLPGQTCRLTVASTNDRALRLYERLGFEKTAVRSKWYRVLL